MEEEKSALPSVPREERKATPSNQAEENSSLLPGEEEDERTPLNSTKGELAVLKEKLTAAEAKLEKWSDAVEKAPIGSEERNEAKEERAFWHGQQTFFLRRVEALEGQIAGKCFLLNKTKKKNSCASHLRQTKKSRNTCWMERG